jgi:hypothetical protein
MLHKEIPHLMKCTRWKNQSDSKNLESALLIFPYIDFMTAHLTPSSAKIRTAYNNVISPINMFRRPYMRQLLAMLFVTFFVAFSTVAQDESTIEYGQLVTGEITNREFEIPYTFTGKGGDVILITMSAVEALGDLNQPEIILLDGEAEIIADTSGAFNVGGALLAIQLPGDDTYTILATRNDGRAGDSVGEFTLELINPPTLVVGEPLNDTISSDGRDAYYVIENNTAGLVLSYQRQDGDFAPQIAVNFISDDFDLSPVSFMGGDELERGEINVPTSEDFYIVNVGEALFDFNFSEVTADYELELREAE